MNNAHILAFASEDYGLAGATSHLGAGTFTDVSIFDPKSQIPQNADSQSYAKRPRNSSSRNSSSSKLTISTTDLGKGRLDSRLEAQRQFVCAEIAQIIIYNKPQALLIEIFKLVQLLCLYSHSEEKRLWEYSAETILYNVESVIIPKIKKYLEKFQEHLLVPYSTTGSEHIQVEDTGEVQSIQEVSERHGWVETAKALHQIIQDILDSMALLQSLLGPHRTSGKKFTYDFKTEALLQIAQAIKSLEIRESPALIALENLAKNAISYFVDNIDKLATEEDESSFLTTDLEVVSMDAENYVYKSFFQDIDKITTNLVSELPDNVLSTLSFLSDGAEPALVKNLCCARDFFVLMSKIGEFCRLSESIDETIELVITSGILKIQRLLRKDRATYVTNTTKNIITIYQFLSFIQFNEAGTNSILRTITWRHLLQDFSEHIEDSLPTLLLQTNWPSLRAMIRILVCSDNELSISSSKILLHAWTTYVQNLALNRAELPDIIDSLLQLRQQLSNIVKFNFQDEKFKSGVSTGITRALSSKDVSAKVINQLSKYCDGGIRQLNKNPGDGSALSNALEIFKLLPDKDAFAQVYARDLSRRLLISKNCNVEAERQLIDGILSILGETDCTIRLGAMLEDYSAAKVHQSLNLGSEIVPAMEFSAVVLEKKTWPDVPSLKQELKLPSVLSLVLNSFEKEYASENQKKKLHKLDWSNYALHQLTIKVAFNSGFKELMLNLFQATVLMAFESNDTLLVEDLEKSTGLTHKFLTKVLLSLSSPKYPILKLDHNLVIFNSAFEDRQSRIRIPMIKEKENAIEETRTNLTVSRSSQVRAAMVRDIKAKKQIPYIVFLATFLEKFTWASMADLKLAIEQLITEGFIKRCENDADLQYIP